MSWSDPAELRARLLRLWERGELLRDAVTGATRFPLRLALRAPGSADVTDRFEAVRAWASELAAAPRVRVEWQEIRHRVQGTQKLPASVWVDSLEDALAWLGKRRDFERFAAVLAATRDRHSALLPWLARRPLYALELADEWPRLLAVLGWIAQHPRPGIYLRQVDLPGVSTKFIESRRGVLSELLELVLPADALDTTKSGVNQFALRHGFLDKPTRIRFRVLDPAIQAIPVTPAVTAVPAAPGTRCPDISLDADSFSRLALPVGRVFITENEINFLAFPAVPRAIVIFGAGYGWDALAKARWLKDCVIHYWGDIDTHGFAILDQLRGHFGHVEAFLMDRVTLESHRLLWGVEQAPLRVDLNRLTVEERALYDDLRDNRIRAGLRLEQEFVGFQWVGERLRELLGPERWP